jgi:hypothetical protein
MADVLTAEAVRDEPGGSIPARPTDDIVRSAA